MLCAATAVFTASGFVSIWLNSPAWVITGLLFMLSTFFGVVITASNDTNE